MEERKDDESDIENEIIDDEVDNLEDYEEVDDFTKYNEIYYDNNDKPYKEIPLKNHKYEVEDYSSISPEDYEPIMKYRWHRKIIKIEDKKYKFVIGHVEEKSILLSHFIMKPKEGVLLLNL